MVYCELSHHVIREESAGEESAGEESAGEEGRSWTLVECDEWAQHMGRGGPGRGGDRERDARSVFTGCAVEARE